MYTNSAQGPSPAVRIYLLGQFRVVVDGQSLGDGAWRRKKARQVFKCLLTRPNRRLLKETAVDLFWPESDPDAASTNLRSCVHAIRQALELGAQREFIDVDRDSLAVHPGPEVWVDADVFEQTLAQARLAADPVPLLEHAAALYVGDYLPDDLYDDWAEDRRSALRRQWTELNFQLAGHYETRGAPERAIEILKSLLARDAANERAAQELMRVLLDLGRRPEALRVFQGLEVALREQLGVEPDQRTRALRRRAAEDDAALVPSGLEFRCSYPFPAPTQLIGRERELARLQRVVERGRTSGQATLVGGPMGAGKSALVGTLVRSAQAAGVLCLAGGSYEQRGAMPLAPFQEALADFVLSIRANESGGLSTAASDLVEVVRNLRRQLGLAEPMQASGSADRTRLFGAVLSLIRGVAAHRPVLVCLEDVHAADAATLDLFHYLARQTRNSPVVLIATYREEELQAGEPLANLVATLSRERLLERVHLDALDLDQTHSLLRLLLDRAVPRSLSASLHAMSEGNPLYLEQLALALREQGDVEGSASAHLSDAPVLLAIIRQRLMRLSPRLRETLDTAAVLGPAFEHATLVAVDEDRDESELLVDLDEAIRTQILRETPTGYAFSHVLLHEAVYRALSGPRRMLLHRRIAETLERVAVPSPKAHAAELARHFVLAGQGRAIRGKALHYSLQAAREAALLSAHRQAVDHYTQACRLIDAGAEADQATCLEALVGRGRGEMALGRWQACVATFESVVVQSDQPLWRARAHDAISFALHHLGDLPRARAESAAGLAVLEPAPPDSAVLAVRLRLNYHQALFRFLEGRFEAMLPLGERMLAIAGELGTPESLALAEASLGAAHMGSGRIARAIQHFEATLRAAGDAGDKVEMANALCNLGLAYLRGGRFAEAHRHLERAVALYRETASDVRAVLAIQARGRVFLAEGELDLAADLASEAAILAAEAHDRTAAECQDLLGRIESARGNWGASQTHLEQALRMRERVGHAAGMVDTLLGLGGVHEHCGRLEVAWDLYLRALDIAGQMSLCPQAVAASRCVGELYLAMQRPREAAEHIERAFRLSSQIPESYEHAPTLLATARLRAQTGWTSTAITLVEQALEATAAADLVVRANALLAELHEPATPAAIGTAR